MKTHLCWVAPMIVAALLTGCSTPSRVAEMEGRGKKQTYQASFDQVWNAAIDSAQQSDLQILQADRPNGLIVAKRPIRLETFGENVALWIREISPTETSVEVKSRQAGPPLLWVRNWENRIHRSLAANMTKYSDGVASGSVINEPAGAESKSSNTLDSGKKLYHESNRSRSVIREPSGAHRQEDALPGNLQIGTERDRNPETPQRTKPEEPIEAP